MFQIPVGTCIPGAQAKSWLPALKDKGFECFAINFHMTYSSVDLAQLGPWVRGELEGTGIAVSALGYYCNALENPEHVRGLEYAIDHAHLFGTRTVSTFAGALSGRPVPESIPQFKKVFGALARRAADQGVALMIENCPMNGSWESPTCNIGFNGAAWELMFDAVPAENLGLEWEPAHAMGQLIDPVAQLKKWVGRVGHVHGKDANVHWDAVRQSGISSGQPLADFRTPGFGDTDWRQVFTILQKAGYTGCVSIEGYHDPLMQKQWEYTGQKHALHYLKWARGGDFAPNPWA